MGRIFNPLSDLSSYNLEDSIKKRMKVDKDLGYSPGVETDGVTPTEEYLVDSITRDMDEVQEILHALHSGKLKDGSKSLKVKDILTTYDFPQLFYAATEILMAERITPARVVSNALFSTIPYDGTAMEVTIRTLGGVEVEEVPQGSFYPETGSALTDQAFRVKIEVKKYGAKVAGTRDLIESDYWGIFAYTVRSLAEELLNKKEKMCTVMLNEECGYVLMDNADPSNSELGTTTGRGLTGAQNGAMGIDDLMNIIAWMQMRGYNIDTLLMHPFAWAMWTRDPEVREVVIGAGITYIPPGNAAPGWGNMLGFSGLGIPAGKFGSSIGQVTPGQAQAGNFNTLDPLWGKLGIGLYTYPNLTPFGATYQTQPRFADRPFRVIVSPFVPYYRISGGTKAGKYATNLIFADSAKCGLILQKENPTMEQWSDIEREIDFIKIRERYGLGLLEQGRGVCIAKNIVIDRTYTFDNVHSVTLGDLTTSNALV